MAALSKRVFFDHLEYKPHRGQVQIHAAVERVPLAIASCGVRFGKTMAGGAEMAYQGILPRPNNTPKHDFMGWCIGPTHDLANLVFMQTYDYLNLFLRGNIKLNKTDGVMEFRNLGGGRSRIMRRSTEQAEGRKRHVGYAVDFMVVDEASAVNDSVWEQQLRTRLVDRKGRVLMISTPEGRRGIFAENFRRAAHNEKIIAVRLPSWTNPFLDKEWIREQRDTMRELLFRQEFMAEFVAHEGQVFPEDILDKICVAEFEEPNGHGDYVAGLDLAMSGGDYTVLIIGRPKRAGETRPKVCLVERFHKLPIEAQLTRIAARLEAYGGAMCKVDATGLGDPIVNQMVNAGMPVQGVKFTGTSKPYMVNNACALVEREGITLPSQMTSPAFYEELSIYEWKERHSNSVRLTAAAPSGAHDDAVAAFLLFCNWFPAAGTQGSGRWHHALGDSKAKTDELEEIAERVLQEISPPRREMAARGLASPDYLKAKTRARRSQGGHVPRGKSSQGLWRNSLFGG